MAPRLKNPSVERSAPADDYLQLLAQTEVPALLVEGLRDPLLEKGWAAKLAGLSPLISSATIDAGHEANIECPAKVVELVQSYISCPRGKPDEFLARPLALAAKLEGVSKLDHVEPIIATDAEIAKAVNDADLPGLLTALAVLTGDETLLADDLQPPPSRMGASIKPQGGLSQEAQEKARMLSVRALIDHRERGSPPPDPRRPCSSVR